MPARQMRPRLISRRRIVQTHIAVRGNRVIISNCSRYNVVEYNSRRFPYYRPLTFLYFATRLAETSRAARFIQERLAT